MTNHHADAHRVKSGHMWIVVRLSLGEVSARRQMKPDLTKVSAWLQKHHKGYLK
jgi:hypothetical protein